MVSVDVPRDEGFRPSRDDDRPTLLGFTVFFTGLPGSGKSSLALGLRDRLLEEGRRRVRILDGDDFRVLIPSGHRQTSVFRDVTTARISVVAEDVTRGGDIALCAAVAPFQAQRERARWRIGRAGRFLLIYLSTPLEVCAQRDRADLYQGARSGDVEHMTGVTHAYEAPPTPDLSLDNSDISIKASIISVMQILRRERLVI
jgi:sulfate adenylyltransferase